MAITQYALAHQDSLGITPDRLAYLDAWLKDAHQKGYIQQTVVKLNRRGHTLFEAGYGDDGQGGVLSADTIYPVASITKSVLATLFCLLQEDGRVDVGELLGYYIPLAGDNRWGIRLAHLFTHTSGMNDDEIHEDVIHYLKNELKIDLPGSPHDIDHEVWNAALLRAHALLGLPAAANPDEAASEAFYHMVCLKISNRREHKKTMVYCNTGYQLLKRVLDKITGEPIDEFARRSLFEPLGMKDSAWVLPREKWPRVVRRGENTEGYPYQNSEDCFVSTSGAGGLKTTANDILRLAEMIRQGGTLDGRRILSPASIKRMTADYNAEMGNPFFSWALGFNYRGLKYDDLGNTRPPTTLDHGGYGGTKLVIDQENELTLAIFNTTVNLPAIQYPSGIYGRILNIIYSACR